MRDLVPAGSSVFDIGCGNSRLPVALKEKGCTVAIGDISPIVLEGYKAAGLEPKVIDLDKIAETRIEGTYDFIIMSEVLEHLANPEEVIAVLKERTKRFLLTVPNTGFYPFRLRLLFGRFPKQWAHHPSEHVRFWSHADFLEWLAVQGLVVEKAIPSNGFSLKGTMPFLKYLWPNLLAHQVVYQCRTQA